MQMFRHLRNDAPASVVVFFVAVPLCLGIALASGAPLISGLIAGIIGGLVVGSISGSPLGVSGPAAGLAVIVLSAIDELGFQSFLVAVVISGLIQLGLGAMKAGVLGYYFPTAVIRGMLFGIGVIIILKQIPHALGYDADPVGDQNFNQPDGHTTLNELSYMLDAIDGNVVLVSLVSMAILLLWDKVLSKKGRFFQLVQGPLVVVAFGIAYQLITSRVAPSMALAPEHLVTVPVVGSMDELKALLVTPDWGSLGSPGVWLAAFTIAVVGSLETLLSSEATDKLDPQRRVSPLNRELVAQGAGNVCSGLLGGLPITQVIVRSSANVQSGAHTKLSTIMHGALMLIAVLLLPDVLNMVILGVLATILLVVGYKLAHPSTVKQMWSLGWEQFVPFAATVVGLVFTDMLKGIGMGLAVAIIILLRRSFLNSHFLNKQTSDDEQGTHLVHLTLAEEVTFLNRATIKQELSIVPAGSHVTIDTSRCINIDQDVLDVIEDFKRSADERGITVGSITQGRSFDLSSYDKDSQSRMTPDATLQFLMDGNKRFAAGEPLDRDLLRQVAQTRTGQWPYAAVLSCIDSRVPVETIFDLGIGGVFSARVAGNFVNDDILGSLEYACKVAGARLLVVLGHERCGAVMGACDGVELGHITGLLSNLKPAIAATESPREPEQRSSANADYVHEVALNNVRLTTEAVLERSEVLRELVAAGELRVVGAMYDVATGRVVLTEPALAHAAA